MGIQLYHVPADWKHPTDSDYRARRDSMLAYQPPQNAKWRTLYMDESWGEATLAWWGERIVYRLTRLVAYWPSVLGWIEEPMAIRFPHDDESDNTPPKHFDYRPRWRKRDMTHVQLYETVSEGTPISPVMPSVEALADWCAAQTREVWVSTRMDRDGWLRFFGRGGWAPSGVVTPERGFESGAMYMGRQDTPTPERHREP